jgi:hypothetical protein
MIKFYEIKDFADLRARFNFFDISHLDYCLTTCKFPSPFYMVALPRMVGTTYEQHSFLLQWLVENDDCRGDYLFSPDNGMFFFKNKDDALLFHITFSDVTFKQEH